MLFSKFWLESEEFIFSINYEILKLCQLFVFLKDFDGQTPLHLAICNGHEKVVFDLLNAPQIDYFIRNAQGFGIFKLAVDLRQRSIAQLLFQKNPVLALEVSIWNTYYAFCLKISNIIIINIFNRSDEFK